MEAIRTTRKAYMKNRKSYRLRMASRTSYGYHREPYGEDMKTTWKVLGFRCIFHIIQTLYSHISTCADHTERFSTEAALLALNNSRHLEARSRHEVLAFVFPDDFGVRILFFQLTFHLMLVWQRHYEGNKMKEADRTRN